MNTDLGISGKIAIVTGASTGIGRATAEEIGDRFSTEVLPLAIDVADPGEPIRVQVLRPVDPER
jgi:NAD(P)-dependent dehydrogenase (short-subunit alcohol dehydrogenase family)